MKAMAGGLGLDVDLSAVPMPEALREDQILYSESAGRFIVTLDPKNQSAFEKLFEGMPVSRIGQVTADPRLVVRGLDGKGIIDITVPALREAWQKPFGDLI
jgi:phosphoribosylformylglycinamidine synthase